MNIPRNLIVTCIVVVLALTGFMFGRALAAPTDGGVPGVDRPHVKISAGMPIFSSTVISEKTTKEVSDSLKKQGWEICRMECTYHLCIAMLATNGIVGLAAFQPARTPGGADGHFINIPISEGDCPKAHPPGPHVKKVSK